MKHLFTALCLVAVLTYSCKNDASKDASAVGTDIVNNPATANGTADTSNVPVFSFTEETHDFGAITQGEKVSYNFKFKNTGKSDLVIASATASCGCTVPEYPKQPVAPGAEGVLTVTFDSANKEGKVSKTITIISNTVPNTKVLTITADISVPAK